MARRCPRAHVPASAEKELNGLFGTRVPAYKLAEKLRNSGNWNQVLTDTEEPYGSDEA